MSCVSENHKKKPNQSSKQISSKEKTVLETIKMSLEQINKPSIATVGTNKTTKIIKIWNDGLRGYSMFREFIHI